MADKTITDLIADLLVKMSEVSEQGADLVRSFKAQAEAIDEMKRSADNLGETLKNLGAIKTSGAGPVYNNTDNVAPWDINTKVANATVNQQNTTANYAQAAINSGSATNMQNAIDSLTLQIENTRKYIIDPARAQLQAAQAAGNTAKTIEISKNLNDAVNTIDNLQMQIARIKQQMTNTSSATKTYRLEIKSATGTSSITVDSEAQAQALLASLGAAARLV